MCRGSERPHHLLYLLFLILTLTEGNLQETNDERLVAYVTPGGSDTRFLQRQILSTNRRLSLQPTYNMQSQEDENKILINYTGSSFHPSLNYRHNRRSPREVHLPGNNTYIMNSTRSGMILCSHPPEIFSKDYLGDSITVSNNGSCAPGSHAMEVSGTYELCILLYNYIQGIDIEVQVLTDPDIGEDFYIYTDEFFVKMCVPLFQRFHHSRCIVREMYTKCDTDIFVHKRFCPALENGNHFFDLHVFYHVILDDLECLKRLCDGTYSIVETEVYGLRIVLTRILGGIEAAQCTYSLNTSEYYQYRNLHWPCCYPLYEVYWPEDPRIYGLDGAWHFLPPSCRAAEICLITMVAFVAVFGFVGNLVVVIVLVNLAHHREESNMLRLSLAFADLFTTVFAVWPSLYSHVEPFIIPFELQKHENTTGIKYYEDVDSGHRLFQGLVFTSCSIVSLLTLFILSLDRFVRTGRWQKYKHYFTPLRVKAAICITWIAGISSSLFMTHFMQTNSSGRWLTFTKLSLARSNYYMDNTHFKISDFLNIIYIAVTIPCTCALSVLSIRNFLREQAKAEKDYTRWKTRISGKSRLVSENRRILITQMIMTSSFFISTIPVGIEYIGTNFTYFGFTLPAVPLFSYLAWWLHLASVAWNPIIYNVQSSYFRKHMREVFAKYGIWAVFRSRKQETLLESREREREAKLLARVGIVYGEFIT